jgi:hypothetical protein
MRSFNEFLKEGKTFEIDDVMGMKVYVCTDKAGKEMFDPESGEAAKFNEKDLYYSWKKNKNFFYSSENAAKKDLEESGLKAIVVSITIPSAAKKFINESKQDDTYFAGLDIENTEKIYQIAMRAKDSKSLEKSMDKVKSQFPDADKIDFSKVEWEEVYSTLNEKTKTSGGNGYIESMLDNEKFVSGVNDLIDATIDFIEESKSYAKEKGISTSKQQELIIDDVLDFIKSEII